MFEGTRSGGLGKDFVRDRCSGVSGCRRVLFVFWVIIEVGDRIGRFFWGRKD